MITISLLMFSFIIGLASALRVEGSYSTIIHENETMHFYVEDLNASYNYDFNVTYELGFIWDDEVDLGFSLHLNNHFKDPLVTVDSLGMDDESTTYSPASSGDLYIKVWCNSDDDADIEITVTEHGTLEDMDINFTTPSFVSQYTWVIVLAAVGGGLSLLVIPLPIIVGALAMKKQKEIVAKARESGEALPRTGRKKDKCPFCGVKLPQENFVTCPYCAAPITE
ncbi:MAG: hypothetical protein ACTSPK_13335 [Candidatus Heimdallarchaeota archaeon]